MKVGIDVANAAWEGYSVYDTAVNSYETAKTYTTAMKAYKDFALADWYAINGAKQGIATFASAPGIQLPKFLGGKVLLFFLLQIS